MFLLVVYQVYADESLKYFKVHFFSHRMHEIIAVTYDSREKKTPQYPLNE